MDSVWDNDPAITREAEWTKISSDFTNAGYREGITAGKESSLQEGFDHGFASVGVPLGREVGLIRGACSAMLSFTAANRQLSEEDESILEEIRGLSAQLKYIRLVDIAPPDIEAEEHARQHMESELKDEAKAQAPTESQNDGGPNLPVSTIQLTRKRLVQLGDRLGLNVSWDHIRN